MLYTQTYDNLMYMTHTPRGLDRRSTQVDQSIWLWSNGAWPDLQWDGMKRALLCWVLSVVQNISPKSFSWGMERWKLWGNHLESHDGGLGDSDFDVDGTPGASPSSVLFWAFCESLDMLAYCSISGAHVFFSFGETWLTALWYEGPVECPQNAPGNWKRSMRTCVRAVTG